MLWCIKCPFDIYVYILYMLVCNILCGGNKLIRLINSLISFFATYKIDRLDSHYKQLSIAILVIVYLEQLISQNHTLLNYMVHQVFLCYDCAGYIVYLSILILFYQFMIMIIYYYYYSYLLLLLLFAVNVIIIFIIIYYLILLLFVIIIIIILVILINILLLLLFDRTRLETFSRSSGWSFLVKSH